MKRLDIRLSDEDKAILDKYCQQKEMTQSDAVRTWIRGLKRKVRKRCDPGELCSPKERAPRKVSDS